METTFNKKYKDRDPMETVSIIHSFFVYKGFNIQVERLAETECGTWGCVVILFANDQFIFSQNGKGTTKEFALASGYAELFERFSNKLGIYNNPILGKAYTDLNYKTNDYYLCKDEKFLSAEDIFEDIDTSQWLNTLFNTRAQSEQYLNIICQNGIIGVPYNNFGADDIKYWDPRIITHMMMSSGLAAGNTVEEALVQGMSEIFEHYAGAKIHQNKYDKYYSINRTILPRYLQNIITRIESKGNRIKIFDLSYNTGVPVCMALLMNKFSYNYHINFGSAPTFNLAVERTLTELYQNKFTYWAVDKMAEQKPFYGVPWYETYINGFSSFPRSDRFPEDILLKSVEIDNYNQEIFLDSSQKYSNSFLMEYYNEICKDLNTSIFYHNNSPIKEMAAIQIFCPGLDLKPHEKALYVSLTTEEKDIIFNQCIGYWSALQKIKEVNCDKEAILDIMSQLKNIEKTEKKTAFGFLLGSDWFYPYPKARGYQGENLLNIFLNDETPYEQLLLDEIANIFKRPARKNCVIANYAQADYDFNTAYELLKNLGISIFEEEYKLYKERWYMFYQVFIKEYQAHFNSSQNDIFLLGNC